MLVPGQWELKEAEKRRTQVVSIRKVLLVSGMDFPGFHIFVGFHSFDIVLIVFSCFFQGIPFPLGVWNGLKDLAKQLEVEQELPSVI